MLEYIYMRNISANIPQRLVILTVFRGEMEDKVDFLEVIFLYFSLCLRQVFQQFKKILLCRISFCTS